MLEALVENHFGANIVDVGYAALEIRGVISRVEMCTQKTHRLAADAETHSGRSFVAHDSCCVHDSTKYQHMCTLKNTPFGCGCRNAPPLLSVAHDFCVYKPMSLAKMKAAGHSSAEKQ